MKTWYMVLFCWCCVKQDITVSGKAINESKWVLPSTNKETIQTQPDCLNNDRICENFTSDVCGDVISFKNNASHYVSRECRYSNNETERLLRELFPIIFKENGDQHTDDECIMLSKWFLCSLIYPTCSMQDGTFQLPCDETCVQVEKCYPKLYRNIFKFNETFYKERMTQCLLLPKKEDGKCVYKSIDIETKKKTPPPSFSRKDTAILIGAVCGSIIVFVLVLAAIIYKKRASDKIVRTLSLYEVKEVHGNRSMKVKDNCLNLGITNPKYESVSSMVHTLGITVFSKENLEFDQNLGEGAFGKVVKCKTKNMTQSIGNIDMVAVKYLKENPEAEMEITFQRELEILSNFNHPNVIPLVGVCLDTTGPMCLILEFMKYGDLNQYIRLRSGSFHAVAGSCGDLPDGVEFQSPELSYHNLLSITSQIADGVSYLASKRFVHRDIATRNILVGDNLQVKISDFGLAHDIYGSDYYRVSSQKLLPLRWLSPEALTLGKFTIYSDMYSFGVTMWEIFTYGMQPFYGCNNEEVCNKIRGHKLLERPYCCPPNIYALMKVCWKFEPTHRKGSVFIKETIDSWLEADEHFIRESWKRLMIAPLSERRPTILKSKKLHRFIKKDITL